MRARTHWTMGRATLSVSLVKAGDADASLASTATEAVSKDAVKIAAAEAHASYRGGSRLRLRRRACLIECRESRDGDDASSARKDPLPPRLSWI